MLQNLTQWQTVQLIYGLGATIAFIICVSNLDDQDYRNKVKPVHSMSMDVLCSIVVAALWPLVSLAVIVKKYKE